MIRVSNVFTENVMGYFQDVRKRRLKTGFEGIFRATRGSNKPFIDLYAYAGSHSFSPECIYLVNTGSGRALNLSPLVFWDLEGVEERGGAADMFFYDTSRESKRAFGFKAVMLREEFPLEGAGDLEPVFEDLQRMREGDPELSILEGVELTPTWEREG